MKEYCVDLEIAKELKENGFPQKRHFKWEQNPENGESYLLNYHEIPCIVWDKYSAPTSDELLNELPIRIDDYILEITRRGCNRYDVAYRETDPYDMDRIYYLDNHISEDDKLSNALAKTWLHLKREGYLDA